MPSWESKSETPATPGPSPFTPSDATDGPLPDYKDESGKYQGGWSPAPANVEKSRGSFDVPSFTDGSSPFAGGNSSSRK